MKKTLGRHGQKRVQLVWSWKSKSDYLNNEQIEETYVFAYWWEFRKVKNCYNDFWVAMVKNGDGLLVHDTL